MEIKTPAKVNLYLNVGEKRSDGFHDIISLMMKISFWDTLCIEEAEGITVEGPEWLPMEENIVYKAAKLMQETSETNKGCRIRLVKNIPPGRGLGGGSSDCAATLKALNEFWELKKDITELEQMGAKLGSDVNFFLYTGGCLATGRGENIVELGGPLPEQKEILIIDTGIEISTKSVYSKYEGNKLTPKEELDKIIEDFREGNWKNVLRNDLEEVVFKEFLLLKDLKSRLLNWGTYPLLSGSGSCMFALAENKETLESIAGIIKEDFQYNTWIVEAVE